MPPENGPLVVVADDHPDVLRMLELRIRQWGYRVAPAATKAELMFRLSTERPALVLLDLQFGDTDGLELLQQLLGACPDLPIAMLTGYGSIDAAVAATRLGAYDFLTKPPDTGRLRVLIAHAVEKQAMAARIRKLETLHAAAPPGLRLLGDSPAMQRVLGLIRSVAATDATVLLLGESGTGKELAARTLHDLSRRADAPFVPMNMAALPRDLAESLLFGHEKGAFTGADRAQLGACELADKGTLFLDEIGEMDLGLQAKLLRFLQERSVQRVGNPKAIPVDVRVVAATNRDLAERVRTGLFREDLYYRLKVIPVNLPPLRERREDIPLMAERFLQKATVKYNRDGLSFRPEALAAMAAFDWPGNVRQLENLVERLAILCPAGPIGPEALDEEFLAPSASPTAAAPAASAPASLAATPLPQGAGGQRLARQVERQAIVEALARAEGNVRDASYHLGLSPATVYRKLKAYGLNADDFARAAAAVG